MNSEGVWDARFGGGMLKGSRTSLTDGEPANDRPRKKLSFRDPEVMGAVDRKELEEASRRRNEADRRMDEQSRWREKRVSPQGESVRRKISVVERGELDGRKEELDKGWRKTRGDDDGDESGRRKDKVVPETERRRVERSLTAERDWLHRRISEEDEEELEVGFLPAFRTIALSKTTKLNF